MNNKTPLLSMRLLPIFLVSSLSMTLPSYAHANIFDPILKVLLPFYDSDTPDQSKQPKHQQNSIPKSQEVSNDSFSDTKALTSNLNNPNNPNNLNNLNNPNNNGTNNSNIGNTNDIFAKLSKSDFPVKLSDTELEPNLYALLKAEFSIGRGDPTQALSLYKEQAFARDATAVFERALSMSLQYEEPKQSLVFATKWYLQNPDHVPAWFYVAHLALQAHDYELAGNTLQRILSYDPQADLSQILKGIFPKEENDQQLLLTTLQQLNNTENSNLSILQAGLLLENEPKIALVHANRALESEPDNVLYITLKADILKQLKRPTEVLNFIGDARKRLPEEDQLYLYEVRYRLNELSQELDELDNQANNDRALTLVLEANERFSDDPEITLLASLVSLDNGAYDIGERLLSELLERPAYTDKANYYLGISAERQHRYQDAKDYFASVMQEELALEASKKIVAYELLLGDGDGVNDTESNSNTKNNAVSRALQALIDVRTNFPIHAPQSYLLQADILNQQSETNEAKELLAEANKNYPENVAIQRAYVKLLDDHNDYDKKYHLLEDLMITEIDNVSPQLQFATLLLSKNPSSKQGKLLAEQLTKTPFSDPKFDADLYLEALNILAKSSLENREYQSVIDYLQMPYEYLPYLPTGLLLLEAYQALGNTQLAAQLQTDLQQKFGYQPINKSSQNTADIQLIEPQPKPFVPNLSYNSSEQNSSEQSSTKNKP